MMSSLSSSRMWLEMSKFRAPPVMEMTERGLRRPNLALSRTISAKSSASQVFLTMTNGFVCVLRVNPWAPVPNVGVLKITVPFASTQLSQRCASTLPIALSTLVPL